VNKENQEAIIGLIIAFFACVGVVYVLSIFMYFSFNWLYVTVLLFSIIVISTIKVLINKK
jgi:hypothetical protein